MSELRLGVGLIDTSSPDFEKEAIVAETLGRGWGAARKWLGKGTISAAQQATMKPVQTSGRFGNFMGRAQAASRMQRMGIPATGEFTASGAQKGIEQAGTVGVSPEMAGGVMYRSRLPFLGRRAVKKEMGGQLTRSAYGARTAMKPENVGMLASQVLPGRAGRGISRQAETMAARGAAGQGPTVRAVQQDLSRGAPGFDYAKSPVRTRQQVGERAQQFQSGMTPPPPPPRAAPSSAATPPPTGGAAAAEGAAGAGPRAPFNEAEYDKVWQEALAKAEKEGLVGVQANNKAFEVANAAREEAAAAAAAAEAGAGAGAGAGAEAAKKGFGWKLPLAVGGGLGAGGYMYGAGEADRRANNQMDQWLLNAGYLQQPYGY